MNDTAETSQYHDSDREDLAQWQRVGPLLEERRQQEARDHGPRPYDWRIVDSLLQLGFLHGNRNPPTGLIAWQARLASAYQKRDPALFSREKSD